MRGGFPAGFDMYQILNGAVRAIVDYGLQTEAADQVLSHMPTGDGRRKN